MIRDYDDDEYYDQPDPVYTRGCRCNSLSESPCRYCEGAYRCPGGCGNSAYDCECCDGGCGQRQDECMCEEEEV